MEIQKKVFTSEIKGIDEKEGSLTAYISTNTIDRMREVLDPEGVDWTNYKKNPVVLWAHDYSLPPIGKAMWVKKDGQGILSKVKFASTEFAQEVFQLYKEGFMKTFSVGFIPKETEYAKDEDRANMKKPRLTYKKWELLEYSAVPVPANPDAVALAIQKGILKTDSLKQILSKDVEDEWEESPSEEKIEEAVEKINGLDDLLAENKILSEKTEALGKENSDLRVRLFNILTKYQAKQSEMVVDDFASKAVEIIDGAIRKAQGKVK